MNDTLLLDLKIDFTFKQIFGRQDNRDILAAFLNALLKLAPPELITAEGIELLNPFLLKEDLHDKYGILDIRARLTSGTQLNIEIQLATRRNMAERTVYYFSKMFAEQLHGGEDYQKLKKTIVINILNFELLEKARSYHSVFHLWEDSERLKLTDVAEFHIIELPRLRDVPGRVDSRELQWLLFLKGVSDEVLEGWSMNEPMLKKARTVQEVLSHDKEMRYMYEQRRKALLDRTTTENWIRETQEERQKAEEERQKAEEERQKAEEERQKAEAALEQEKLRAEAVLEQERNDRHQRARALIMTILTTRFPTHRFLETIVIPADTPPELLEILLPGLITAASLQDALQILQESGLASSVD